VQIYRALRPQLRPDACGALLAGLWRCLAPTDAVNVAGASQLLVTLQACPAGVSAGFAAGTPRAGSTSMSGAQSVTLLLSQTLHEPMHACLLSHHVVQVGSHHIPGSPWLFCRQAFVRSL